MLKMGMLAGVLTAFAAGAFAQHEEHHPQYQPTQEYKTQAQVQPGQATPSSPSGMMRGGMMMGQNQQMSDSINKMIENMAAIQNEKDPAKMKAMMAQQNTMLEHMRNQMMQQDSAMQNMSGMMMKTCPMMGEDTKPSTK
jgi:hypothetical protein